MRVNIVTGLANRFSELTRLWAEHRDSWDAKHTKPEPNSEAPASPAQPPKHALVNPRRGTAWFANNVLRQGQKKIPNPHAARVGIDDQSGNPGLGATRRADREGLDPIPANAPGASQIKPDKPRDRLVSDASDDRPQFSTGKHRDTPAWKNETADAAAGKRRSINQRAAFFHLLEKTLKELPSIRW